MPLEIKCSEIAVDVVKIAPNARPVDVQGVAAIRIGAPDSGVVQDFKIYRFITH